MGNRHTGFVSKWLHMKKSLLIRVEIDANKETEGEREQYSTIDLFEYYSWSIDIPWGEAYIGQPTFGKMNVVQSQFADWYWASSRWVCMYKYVSVCVYSSVSWFKCPQVHSYVKRQER